jgi:hypothetical protein
MFSLLHASPKKTLFCLNTLIELRQITFDSICINADRLLDDTNVGSKESGAFDGLQKVDWLKHAAWFVCLSREESFRSLFPCYCTECIL